MGEGREALKQFEEDGVVLLRDVFSTSLLATFRQAGVQCFTAIEARTVLPEKYKYNQFSNSLLIEALADADCARPHLSINELSMPLAAPSLGALCVEALAADWTCGLEHSWVRKKFAPGNSPDGRDASQGWHQDGGLGVQFPEAIHSRDERGYWISTVPMTELATCWLPLEPCGRDAPGLEFVRGSQPGLLHFTELADGDVRKRFAAERFWAPEMEPGDAVVFRNSVLHQTYVSAGMTRDRMSVEYRVFPV